ncbi:hypothetical protein H4V97_000055 [Flavobacterium sp. CG_23.5]|uniref:transcriptional regulator n=1 Tax=Flavobacterium sp. CG_23.5 TaxID=2760708 RepID=UPI001AE7EAC9|nr:transcriptional regulator [Flavobacterium sp. CG_23.5]MBP2281737.1 hypothetical protein [Flavobacterium sp. CG_23.5]
MNYIKHLTGFFNRIALENTLNPTHISLYITIFQCWNVNRFKNPITITRDEMMKGSKIASNATYHKCIKDLQRLGYLDYNPSFNPYSGTSITVHNFSEGYKSKSDDNELTCSKNESTRSKNDRTSSKNEQPIGQATEQVNGQLYIENKKTYKNNKNNIERTPEFEILDDNLILENPEKNKRKEKSSAKKEKVKAVTSNVSSRAASRDENPTLELTKEYFKFQEYSEFEAERFFNYYSSNGWLIGGKTKMKDWKAAARNWMMNTNKFNVKTPQNIPVKEQTRAYNLHAAADKNYGEPL